MERLDFSNETAYDAAEACIHLNRYAFARPFCEGTRILDAACGEGYGSYLMKTWGAKEVVGVDIDETSVQKATDIFAQEGLSYVVHTVEKLPFEDASFDVVVSFETIEHVDDPEAFLKEIRRVAKPDATIIISCPNDNYYYQNACEKNPFHKREYTFFQFKEKTEKYLGTGVEYFFSFALDGFINLPSDACTHPEDNIQENIFSMLRYEHCDSALRVPQERYLNKWNANYYIGIWGERDNMYRISTVLAPRETFIEHKDKDFDFIQHVRKLQKEVELSRITIENQTMTNERLTTLLELIQNERAQQREVLYSLQQQLRMSKEAIETQTIANARLEVLLELTRKERDQLRMMNGAYDMKDYLRDKPVGRILIRMKRFLARCDNKLRRMLRRKS